MRQIVRRLTFLLLFIPFTTAADSFPEIRKLDSTDVLFAQIQNDISECNLLTAQGKPPPPLLLFTYRTRKDDDLYALAARLNLPYETIATINGITGPGLLSVGKELLVPNIPGVFVPVKPVTELDRIMASWRKDSHETVRVTRSSRKMEYAFFPNARFHPLERAYFLGILFRFPIPDGIISSGYGPREDPFSGAGAFHGGLDIAAPQGTEVLAAAAGTVRETGYNDVLGNFITITHFGGFETVYGHLRKVYVKLEQEVIPGHVIGIVGNTGLSTGPHLHFEIRADGRLKDPETLLPRGKK